MNPEQPAPNERMANSIEAVSDGETKLAEVRKHPFGIILLYIEAFLGLGAALGLMYLLVPQFATDDTSQSLHGTLAIITIVAVVITLLVLLVASVVYHQSYLIFTNKNVTEVLQRSLFSRQVSELSMANIEDVTANQKGIFATIFNYGTITVETAGEQNNFIFSFCPRPNYYAKILLDTRQQYVDADPYRAVRANNRLNMPQTPPPSPPPQMPPTTT